MIAQFRKKRSIITKISCLTVLFSSIPATLFDKLHAFSLDAEICISECIGPNIKPVQRDNHVEHYGFEEFLSQEQDTTDTAAEEKKVSFTIRLGQGGFNDDRSPLGKLGGGQLTLDIKPAKLPLALSISSEYYKNRQFATHSYEIDNLYSLNVLYMSKPFPTERITVFLGVVWVDSKSQKAKMSLMQRRSMNLMSRSGVSSITERLALMSDYSGK
ncbi:hypothetical protein ACFL27_13400 [candidate division CSSED10-310 bacterium]|uniref:Outer membrane protein beta-barrel domain-containing protein n=1 Tax=candidate division CSSED10-310 bacterium TaxID=2855610 RepID=A0ABV6YYB6_UNCC1